MKTQPQEIENQIDHLKEVLKENGIKLTHQRVEIFREIAQTKDHPNAEIVFQRIRKKLPMISLDTVYRTLWLLKDLGLIGTIGYSRESTRFDANLDRHHHFVCVKCGMTRDFYSDKLNNLKLPESINDFGTVQTAYVEVKGTCKECGEKIN
jgi:Fur family peroxide stress response transcriptional regulator